MPATYILLGEPDWVGMLIYALIFFGSLAGFVLVICFIYFKVFRSGRDDILTIGHEQARGREHEQS